jgi:hypothetical protein
VHTQLPSAISLLQSIELLSIHSNQLKSLPPEIGSLKNLRVLNVRNNQLQSLPAEIGQLMKLEELFVHGNVLKLLPAAIGQLTNLRELGLAGNHLKWLPAELGALQTLERLVLANADWRFCDEGDRARRIDEILSATTHIGFIRERATEICIGLQDLELPAFVTLTIIDAAVHENSIRMWAKWELIAAVKHFHERARTRSSASRFSRLFRSLKKTAR